MFESHLSKKLKHKKVRLHFREDIEPQEVFLDNLAHKKEESLGVSEKKIEVPLSKKILQGFFIICIAVLLLLLGKAFQLQILQHQQFASASEKNRFIVRALDAERGVIYDSSGTQLVFNQPSFDLLVDPSKLPAIDSEKKKTLEEVAALLNVGEQELEQKILNTPSPVLITEDIDHSTLILLETKIDDLHGFYLQQNTTRQYQNAQAFAHLIGYTSRVTPDELKKAPNTYTATDYVGRDGIEKSYENILRTNAGKLRIERDALGNQITKEVVQLPQSGKSVVLWADAELQKKLYDSLAQVLKDIGAEKAAAVALDPNTGGILALVSIPSFDNNLFNRNSDTQALKTLFNDPLQPLFDRAIAGLYPSGSSIKPLIASGVLEENIISPTKQIYDGGSIEIPNKYDPSVVYTFHGIKPHGWVNMRQALAVSSNIYFFTVGGGYQDQQGLGPSRIEKYLKLFGWGTKTGIDLPGEQDGFIPTPNWKKTVKKSGWWDGDTYNLSIGQGGLQITPLQLATAISTIANGGTLFEPKVVKQIVDQEKNVASATEPTILKDHFISPKTLQIVREGMRMAVTGETAPDASAVLLNSLPVPVAAKTGTAETPKQNHYHNWVTVFAPYDNPRIVLTVMIENVEGVRAAAVPVAKEVLQWYFTRTSK